ncbi:hypothetical protein GCM10008967_23050 [Bacillus carboniphilus]|uniref:Flagellar FliJ protein n=1 Tax=Bacillus carboniphilus TaxID=86663 RepID=A0ABP3G2I5_9BACI
MSYQFRYESVLSIKEKEKDQVRQEYIHSVDHFEQAATQLYELLRKKEQLEQEHEQALSKGLTVLHIKQIQHYRKNLEKSIDQSQNKVSTARQAMQIKEFELHKSDVEVKKYSKLKERDRTHYQFLIKQEEAKVMDEAALRQFTNQKFR